MVLLLSRAQKCNEVEGGIHSLGALYQMMTPEKEQSVSPCDS